MKEIQTTMHARFILAVLSVFVVESSCAFPPSLFAVEFVITDSIPYRSYPNPPAQGAVTGARLAQVKAVGNRIVFLIEQGEAIRRFFRNQKTVAMGLIDVHTKKLQFMEIKHAESERQMEFESFGFVDDDLIEFGTIWSDRRDAGRAERSAFSYHRNLSTDQVTKLQISSTDYNQRCPRVPGFYLKQVDDGVTSTLIEVTDEASGKHSRLRTYYPIIPDTTSAHPRLETHYEPNTYLSAGDAKTPLLLINFSNNKDITSKVFGLNLQSKERTELISGDDIEEELGRADCIGMQPVGNLRYPLSQLPLIVSFKTGHPVCVILKEGQIEWVVQLGMDQRWRVALASANERYLGIISYSFARQLFLADCEQKTISPPLEFDYRRLRKYRSYDLSGVTDDGQLILCDRDIVLARYKERWELERVKVLDPPMEQDFE